MAVYLGKNKVGMVKKFYGQDRLQWKCDNLKSLAYEFYNTKLTDYSQILGGLDTSNVTNMARLFYNCGQLTSVDLLHFDTSNVTSMDGMFNYCTKLTNVDLSSFNTSKVTGMEGMFYYCSKLTTIIFPNIDTSKVTSFSNVFYNCSELIENPMLDMYKSNIQSGTFYGCTKIEVLNVKNVRKALVIGSGTSYGTLINKDSLINTIKELWDYSSGTTIYKLTMSTASKELIADVYVKLVDVTDEMLAEDQYADQKMPCEVCESTDEGAMLITDYATAKGWTIA